MITTRMVTGREVGNFTAKCCTAVLKALWVFISVVIVTKIVFVARG